MRCHLFNGINLANMFNLKNKFLFLCPPVWLLTGVKAPVLPISPRCVALSAMPQAESHVQTSLTKSTVGWDIPGVSKRANTLTLPGYPAQSLGASFQSVLRGQSEQCSSTPGCRHSWRWFHSSSWWMNGGSFQKAKQRLHHGQNWQP